VGGFHIVCLLVFHPPILTFPAKGEGSKRPVGPLGKDNPVRGEGTLARRITQREECFVGLRLCTKQGVSLVGESPAAPSREGA
jgi:hypothetical protein